MSPLLFLAPLWLLFEVGQLVIAERYLGIKYIVGGLDPRRAGPSERLSFSWTACIVLYWTWLALMIYQPVGRLQVVAMIAITTVGFMVRRNCGIKWILVILTFEGALRIGMLLSLCVAVWRRL
jgi:hypothetical protein